jgi:membrane protein DedA with SNARE-associated domain
MKELIHQYGAWIVFALVFLESICLPLPGEAILVSAAIFAATTQDLSIALVLPSAALGAMLGSTIGFWICDRYGYPLLLRYGSYIGLTETRIKIAQYLFRGQGMVVVLIARFVAVLRSVVGFIAGANRMPFANFMIANSAGAVVWALFYGLGAYYLGKGVEEFAPIRDGAGRGRGHRGGLDDPLLAAQGTGACGCGRAGHSGAVEDGVVGKGRGVARGAQNP